MNLISILIAVALAVALIAAIGAMNKGDSKCGGNCSTCAMSGHCETADDINKTKEEGQE